MVSKESKKLTKNILNHCTIYNLNFTTPSFGSLEGENTTDTGRGQEKRVSPQVQISSPSSRCSFIVFPHCLL